MTEDEFWKIIDQSNSNAGGDLHRQVDELQTIVDQLPHDEILSFDSYFEACMNRAYHWDVWAAAYIVGGGCSDDAFDDFRGTLIALGRNIFESVTSDCDSFRDVMNKFCFDEDEIFVEGFQYVGMNAYKNRTGKDLPSTRSQPSEPAGEPWDDQTDDLAKRCPRLWNQYGPEDESRARALSEARSAFASRNFKKALREFSKITEPLDTMDQKKLDYCRRKA